MEGLGLCLRSNSYWPVGRPLWFNSAHAGHWITNDFVSLDSSVPDDLCPGYRQYPFLRSFNNSLNKFRLCSMTPFREGIRKLKVDNYDYFFGVAVPKKY